MQEAFNFHPQMTRVQSPAHETYARLSSLENCTYILQISLPENIRTPCKAFTGSREEKNKSRKENQKMKARRTTQEMMKGQALLKIEFFQFSISMNGLKNRWTKRPSRQVAIQCRSGFAILYSVPRLPVFGGAKRIFSSQSRVT